MTDLQRVFALDVRVWTKIPDFARLAMLRISNGLRFPKRRVFKIIGMRGIAKGEMSERSKVHDWKSCKVKAFPGSNPGLSDKKGLPI